MLHFKIYKSSAKAPPRHTNVVTQFQTDTNLYKYTIYSLCRTLQQDLSFDLDRDLQMLVDKKTVLESCVNNTKQNKTAYTDNV